MGTTVCPKKAHPGKIAYPRFAVFGAAGLLPLLLLGLNYALLGVYPFGPKTVLISDLSGQYVDYYAAFRAMLTGGQSLAYSWEAGMGLNFIGLLAYYLSSPISLLVLFFSPQNLPHALALITLLKVGSAGLTFSLYACAVFTKPGFRTGKPCQASPQLDSARAAVIVALAVLYALCAYVVVYSFNLMWLDGVVLLPLVLLAVERLLESRSFFPLYLALVALFAANFYIAYMVGLFAFLYFVARFFALSPFPGRRAFLQTTGLFLGAAVAAAGSLAFFLVPTFLALQQGSGNPFNFSDLATFTPNFSLPSLVTKLPLGAYDSLSNSGLPNIYSGLLPLLLVPAFYITLPFRRRHTRLSRGPLLYALLGVILIASFYCSNLNLAWHAFDTPNSFPYRYSFLFSFLVLFLSLQAFEQITAAPFYSRLLWLIWGVWVAVFAGLAFSGTPFLSSSLLALSLVLLTVYAVLLTSISKFPGKRALLTLLLAGLVAVEAAVNTGTLLHRLDSTYSYVPQSQYAERLKPLAELLQAIPERDGFFRVERTVGRSYNDPLNLHYPGITHFSSLANAELHTLLRHLGFAVSPNAMWANYAGATPVTDSLLGIKYVLSPLDKPLPHLSAYREQARRQGYALYRNPWALPLAFVADRSLLELRIDNSAPLNPFALQNEFLSRALGRAGEEYFTETPATLRLHNLTAVTAPGRTTFAKLDPQGEGVLEFILSPQDSGLIFAYLHADPAKTSAYLGDRYLGPYLDVYNRKILSLGAGNPAANGEISIQFALEEPSLTLYGAHFYQFRQERFAEAVAQLNRQTPAAIEVRGATVKIKVRAGEKALLFTTIPYDPGWKATANDRPLPLMKVAGAFIGVELPPGEQTVVLRFTPSGLKAGAGISLATVFTVVGCLLYRRLKKRGIQESAVNIR